MRACDRPHVPEEALSDREEDDQALKNGQGTWSRSVYKRKYMDGDHRQGKCLAPLSLGRAGQDPGDTQLLTMTVSPWGSSAWHYHWGASLAAFFAFPTWPSCSTPRHFAGRAGIIGPHRDMCVRAPRAQAQEPGSAHSRPHSVQVDRGPAPRGNPAQQQEE